MGPKTHLILQGFFFLIANFVIIIIIFKVEKRVVHTGSIFFFLGIYESGGSCFKHTIK